MKIDVNQALPLDFYQQDTAIIARQLLGKFLVKRCNDNSYLAAKIVETEAYLHSGDLACHAAVHGKTKRNAAMFERGGVIYVYFIYGFHHCLNVVTEAEGLGAAVLLRALEPVEGIEKMKVNRGKDDVLSLCKGPGCITKAFDISIEDNFASLLSPDLFIQNADLPNDNAIETSGRIGITKDADLPLRFFLKDSPYVSGKKSKNK